MKILKGIGLTLAGLLFLIVIISFFLPKGYKVERSIFIATDASVPFGLAKDFREWDKWSPWHDIDPGMKKTYSETTGEVGSYYTWDSENPDAGKGKVTITQIEENKLIENELTFEGMGSAMANYYFEPAEGGVTVRWTLEGKGKGLPWFMVVPSRYFNLMMDGMIGKDYEKGLAQLKEVSEALPQGDKIEGFGTEVRTMPAFMVGSVRAKVKTNELSSSVFGKWFAQLSQAISQQKLKPIGAPLTIYHQYSASEVDVEAAIPVETMGKKDASIGFREIPESKVFVVKYYGDYNKVENIYNATYEYLKSKNMSSKGSPMEIYITDPGMEKDTAKWLTEIVFPLD